ncbi:MAG: hypothetical protein PF447_07650 [Spirochaetaceae bacterium]|jgi:hypothetical protein|nr:hypothetical protein [Spirochaetaceae bacterium]
MKKVFLLMLPLFFACQSGPSLIPVDPNSQGNPGDFFEVTLDSSMVQQQFEYLQEYLSDYMPDVLPLELDKAYAQVVDGTNIVLICSYSSQNQKSWLKAELMSDREGVIFGKKIIAAYNINLLDDGF